MSTSPDPKRSKKYKRQMSSESSKAKISEGKTLKQRVEEFNMWKDEDAIKELEYEERRKKKEDRRNVLTSDRSLQRWRKGYAPAVMSIVAGSGLLICSSVEGLAKNTVLWKEQLVFQIIGGFLLGAGFIALMVVAACTYHREDRVRVKFGFPNLFEASKSGDASSSHLSEIQVLRTEFVDQRSSSFRSKFSRLTSIDSCESGYNLGASISSASTANAWVSKHSGRYLNTQVPFRCQSSDSALDKSFARAHLYAWQRDLDQQKQTISPDTGTGKDRLNVTEIQSDPNASQTQSMLSSASSGYCSNASTPGVCLLPLIDHPGSPSIQKMPAGIHGQSSVVLPPGNSLLEPTSAPGDQVMTDTKAEDSIELELLNLTRHVDFDDEKEKLLTQTCFAGDEDLEGRKVEICQSFQKFLSENGELYPSNISSQSPDMQEFIRDNSCQLVFSSCKQEIKSVPKCAPSVSTNPDYLKHAHFSCKNIELRVPND